jgi:hypothetical protein
LSAFLRPDGDKSPDYERNRLSIARLQNNSQRRNAMRFKTAWVITAWIGFVLSVAGCQPASQSTSETQPDASSTTQHGHDHAHDHAQGGPHGGHLVCLAPDSTQEGAEYHAEWLHDDESGQITVFLLDAEAENEVTIPTETIEIEVTVGDETRQHLLAAVRGESAGASQFQLTDKSLVEALKAAGHGVEATILAEIEGASYRGAVEHEGHSGHQH